MKESHIYQNYFKKPTRRKYKCKKCKKIHDAENTIVHDVNYYCVKCATGMIDKL